MARHRALAADAPAALVKGGERMKPMYSVTKRGEQLYYEDDCEGVAAALPSATDFVGLSCPDPPKAEDTPALIKAALENPVGGARLW